MPSLRKDRLDERERRLVGPKRVALFGHRAVGKTTLLAMFYREAAHGRVPGVRLAAGDPATAEYLAEKIAQIESGEPPAGTLAETPLRLRLYHGRARLELIVKDYQGEHVSLGSDAPIREFFADCDAVLLCLDPDGPDRPADRRRRQQEVEDLLERYIEKSEEATTDRPVALLVTKYDRVLAQGDESVEEFVDSRYGMTRHALAVHAPRSALFAVSAYGPEAGADGRPPAELRPLGLEGPLGWLADQLEAGDRERLEWLWDLAPEDLPRLARCVSAYAKRYPHSDQTAAFRGRLAKLRRRRLGRGVARLALAGAALVALLAGYDRWGYHAARAFEDGRPAPSVSRRWDEFLAWHPTLGTFWPAEARAARASADLWRVRAVEARVAAGTAGPDTEAELKTMKESSSPSLTMAIGRVEAERAKSRQDEDWRALRVADLAGVERPEAHLDAARKFLRDYPDTPRKAEAVALVKELETVVGDRRDRGDRSLVDALERDGSLPDADLPDLVRRSKEFLDAHAESRWRPEVGTLLDAYARRLDDRDIDRARRFSKDNATNFAVRKRRYQDYLDAHRAGGRFVGEATAALEKVDAERDTFSYRQAYDYAIAHPNDPAEVARQLRAYLDAVPAGRYAKAASGYLKWWEKTAATAEYKVVLRRGEVESDAGKYLSGGAPDLGVELEVGGVKYGPSPVVKNTHKPVWDYEFPRPIRWKAGDPIVIRILDYDWSSSGSGVFKFTSPAGDKLAMTMLSGTVRPFKGGPTTLVFASDFRVPTLPRPE